MSSMLLSQVFSRVRPRGAARAAVAPTPAPAPDAVHPEVRWDTLPPRVPETGTSADTVDHLTRPAEADAPIVNPYWGL